MNEIPPSLASAIASLSPDTACMIADTIGMFIESAGSSPFLNFTTGVFRETFSTLHSVEEYPGTNRYSLNVLDGSSKMYAMISSCLFLDLIYFTTYSSACPSSISPLMTQMTPTRFFTSIFLKMLYI